MPRQIMFCERRRQLCLAAVLCLLPAAGLFARALKVGDATLDRQNIRERTFEIAFDLSWRDSWRNAENWDAAWVFVKFRAPGSNLWEHARLSAGSGDHKAGRAAAIAAVADGAGVFIYSRAQRTGDVSYAGVRLLWKYGENGYAFERGARVEVSAHALETVYIPQGTFYLGSGGGEANHFFMYTDGSRNTNAFLVESESEITVGASPGRLFYANSEWGGDQKGVIQKNFPKGHAAFYCMKYELTQGQWVEFFNKLDVRQKRGRNLNDLSGKGPARELFRNTVFWDGKSPKAVCAPPDRACSFLSWADGSAHADWAGLRPMTELEFEKACRGPALPVANEYAWGNAVRPWTLDVAGCSGEDGSGAETPRPAIANCLISGGLQGPARVGIFAVPGATRAQAGAGYYGVLELSGSLWERTVTVGAPEGRAFRGTHGDGRLDADGNAADNPDWPSGPTALGAGFRGGSWDNDPPSARLSDRDYAAFVNAGRHRNNGWRAVRTAP